jgi:hypothetical protein
MSADGNRDRHEPVDEVIVALERELRQRPNLRLGVLQEFAANIDSAIAALDPRQFQAEYVLPAQRRISHARRARRRKPPPTEAAAPGRRRGPPERVARIRAAEVEEAPTAAVRAAAALPGEGARRDAPRHTPAAALPAETATIDRRRLRAAFLEWARVLAAAESRSQLVAALSSVDRFVDRALAPLPSRQGSASRSPNSWPAAPNQADGGANASDG